MDGTEIHTPEVLSSCWRNPEGERVQVFANFRERDIVIEPEVAFSSVITAEKAMPQTGGEVRIPALGATAIRLAPLKSQEKKW